MNLRSYTYFMLVALLINGCSTKKDQVETVKRIDLDYPDIENIVAIADCIGPGLKYVTEVHSTADGYTYFGQLHEGKENFTAVIFEGKKGFQLNDSLQKVDTLSKESIEIIKGHEFHKIHMSPDEYFEDLTYTKDEPYNERSCENYLGVDKLGNRVDMYYSRKHKRIEGFKFRNAMDTTEQLEVIYKEWMHHEIGSIAKHVDIIQGGTDIYQFDFKEVIINNEDFEKIGNELN